VGIGGFLETKAKSRKCAQSVRVHIGIGRAKTEKMMASKLLEPNAIYRGDCLQLLARIKPESIALSFWSPPYFVGKPYEAHLSYEEWKELLRVALARHEPIIKPGGFVAVNIADILAFRDDSMPRIPAMNVSRHRSPITREDILRVLEEHPEYNRYQIAALLGCSEQTVDRRLRGNNIRGGKYDTQTRVQLVGGLIEEWGREAGFYLYDRRIWVKDPAWQSCPWHTLSYRSIDESEYVFVFWKPGTTIIDRSRLSKKEWAEWGSRGVWHIPSVRANDDHPAKFPIELARRVIRLFSSEGDIVLDPFIGSGTTAIAALQSGRRFIGIDKEEEYVAIARRNISRVASTPQLFATTS